jgi:aminotransferase in exopolysaccharide biosynthesis
MTTAANQKRPINDLPQRVVAAIRTAIGDGPAALHEPRFCGNEMRYLEECVDSTFVSSVGPFVDRFEAELAAYTGARYAVAVVNGTAALHVALRLAGVQPSDEVLIPALTFVATANAVTYCGALPHFVDSSSTTLGLDPGAISEYLAVNSEQRSGQCVNRRTGRVIRAVVPMHTFGHPVDLDGMLRLAADYRLAMVEDAAESLGSYYHGQHTGTFGLMGTLSFNGNKTITTGGGGAILTDDRTLARHAKHLTTTAKLPHRWKFVHDEIGYNYRMPNLNAALGCAQLEQLPERLVSKRLLHERYLAAFDGAAGVSLVTEPKGCHSNYWLQTLLLHDADEALLEGVLEASSAAGYQTRPSWMLMSRLSSFAGCPAMDLPQSDALAKRIVSLPSSAHLVQKEPR